MQFLFKWFLGLDFKWCFRSVETIVQLLSIGGREKLPSFKQEKKNLEQTLITSAEGKWGAKRLARVSMVKRLKDFLLLYLRRICFVSIFQQRVLQAKERLSALINSPRCCCSTSRLLKQFPHTTLFTPWKAIWTAQLHRQKYVKEKI